MPRSFFLSPTFDRHPRRHPVHASDAEQAHALLTRWHLDSQGKVGSMQGIPPFAISGDWH
mgnify:FL=1|jgi:hypothetical protein